MYSDEQGAMTKETCSKFIKGCTGEQPLPNDERIITMFKIYDANNDGRIERDEFFNFFEVACKSKPDTVRDNLKHHNIRNDLKKLSEVTEESSFATKDMPRFKISKNQDQFDLLISLLDRQDEASQASWDLIQMLSTNQDLYKKVLLLQTALDPATGTINWDKFFDSQSVYRLLYTLQIVEAVMEEGEGEGLESAIVIDEVFEKKKTAANIPDAPPLLGPILPPNSDSIVVTSLSNEQAADQQEVEEEKQVSEPSNQLFKKASTIVKADEDEKLKSNWTSMFLQQNGFEYILKVFMSKEISKEQQN